MTTEFIDALTQIVGAQAIKFDELMKLHTTLRVGGPADIFCDASGCRQPYKAAVSCCSAFHIPWMIIGNGSNLLVGDFGIRGVVFQIFQTMDDMRFEREAGGKARVIAGAGILLSKLARRIAQEGLAGFEFASGIPGTFGGAVTMNAGAYGGEIGPLVEYAVVFDQGWRKDA